MKTQHFFIPSSLPLPAGIYTFSLDAGLAHFTGQQLGTQPYNVKLLT